MDATTLLAFAFSFFLIALSPGFCMTLAMTLGISIGVRRTLWWMGGELLGILVVAMSAVGGVATLMVNAPGIFTAAKIAAAAYLVWTAVRTWRSEANIAGKSGAALLAPHKLIVHGFITSTSNPKAWIFMAALLPPFIDPGRAIVPQAAILLSLMMVIEFTSLLIYAGGGRALMELLTKRGLGHWLNRITAGMMVGIAVWLVLS
jgi:threonine/homoserine/homoserine lactone efflux protein